jgi:hypothetical protein
MARTTVESNCYPAGSAPQPQVTAFAELAARALTNTAQGGGAPLAKLLEYCWNR